MTTRIRHCVRTVCCYTTSNLVPTARKRVHTELSLPSDCRLVWPASTILPARMGAHGLEPFWPLLSGQAHALKQDSDDADGVARTANDDVGAQKDIENSTGLGVG